MTLKGSQFNIPTFELSSSQKKPSVRHSISYEDGKLKVSTEVEPTFRVGQIIQREGLDFPISRIPNISMPDKETDIPGAKTESRTITVVSRGETVAVYECLPGVNLSDFDASGDLKWPAPEEHLKLAGWQWNQEGSDRWMEKPSVMPEVNLVVTSLWWPEEYSVTCNGEKTWVPFGHDLYPPEVETPVGMIFDHWEWTVEGSTVVIEKPYTMPACNLIATPFWTPRAYCLTVNGAATQVLYGTALAEPAAPEAPEGHSFGGWKWTVGGAEAAKPATMPACDVTAEPIWTANTYTLTINGAATQVLYGTALAEPAAPEAPEGHSFGGWKWTVGGAEASKPAAMPACDVTAESIWIRNAYTLTFIGNEDGTVLLSQTCYYGDTIPYPTNPTREGKEFTGWSFNVGYTVTTMPACDVTATANWREKEIIPPKDEEEIPPEDVSYYTVEFTWPNDGYTSYQLKEGEKIPYPNEELPAEYAWDTQIETMPGHNITINAVPVAS